MGKSLYDRLKDDILSNNTKADYCKQCKSCDRWGKSGTPWDNKHDKSNCIAFPHPVSMKPTGVINNETKCPFYHKR